MPPSSFRAADPSRFACPAGPLRLPPDPTGLPRLRIPAPVQQSRSIPGYATARPRRRLPCLTPVEKPSDVLFVCHAADSRS